MLASPSQATVLPSIDPFFSSKVMTSAMTWQGWVRLVRPLITGTVACAASSSKLPVRAGADHDGVDVARQHARRIGDGLAPADLHIRRTQHDRGSAKLMHGDFERHPRPRRGLLEDHGEHGAGPDLDLLRQAVAAKRLHGVSVVEDRPQSSGGEKRRYRESALASWRELRL